MILPQLRRTSCCSWSAQGSRLTLRAHASSSALEQDFASRRLTAPHLSQHIVPRPYRASCPIGTVANARRIEPAAYLTPREIDRSVRTLGRNLWNDLFPRSSRNCTRSTATTGTVIRCFCLSGQSHAFPWELVWHYGDGYADDKPWCCTFQMTRWLRLDDQGNGSEGPPANLRLRSLAVLAQDPGFRAREELNKVKSLLNSRGVNVLTPRPRSMR